MKKNFLKILLIALVTFTATACTKEDTSGNNNGTGSSSGSDVFVWTENDNTFAAANTIKCDSAYASAQFKTIFVISTRLQLTKLFTLAILIYP